MSTPLGRHIRVLESFLRVISAASEGMQAMIDELDADALEAALADDPGDGSPRRRSSSKMNAITPDVFETYLRRISARASTDGERRRVLGIVEESLTKKLISEVVAAELRAKIDCK